MVDEFVTDLYRLAEHCEYGILHDELVRDRESRQYIVRKTSDGPGPHSRVSRNRSATERSSQKQQSVVCGEVLRESTIEAVKTCRQPSSDSGQSNLQSKTAGTSHGQNPNI